MSNQIKQYSQCSSDDQILLPMCSMLPANQIIKKNYAPDQTPVIKYIPKQTLKQKTQQKTSYTLNDMKMSNPQFQEYANLFSTHDFLGNFYSNQFNQIVYFKFNNKEYNQLKINDKKYRFFSGFFVEKQHFQDVANQKYDNIMKSFPFLDFTDYNSNLLLSFGKNNKGTAQDPKFSSNYDSANLFAVIKKNKFEYDLILQNDMNSKGNNQWFNFLVHFPEQGTYKFNIVNFTKSHSLYQKGMKIACYSFTRQMSRGNPENHKNGGGWFRGGKNIKYFRNQIQRQTQGPNTSYYTLSFQHTCKNRPQSIIFAYTIPYSGVQLEKYFNKVFYKKVMGHFKMQKIQVCKSIAGASIYGYAISHKKSKFDSSKFKNCQIQPNFTQKNQLLKGQTFIKNIQKRSSSPSLIDESPQLKSVILMARQHPGEVQSSYVLEGIVDYLMSATELDQVKKGYTFFVFPMINVDGVKYGHYRTNLCGFDLNRVWRLPRKQNHPEIYYLKKLLYEINRLSPITLVLDIHGHSKALNSFFYGNPSKKQNLSFEDPKLFPFICSKRIKQISYKQSTFNIKDEKKNSARVVLSEMFPKALVYTLENSFYGYVNKKMKEDEISDDSKDEIIEYTPQGYRKVGRQLISTYLQYTKLSEKNSSIKAKWIKELQGMHSETQKQKKFDQDEDNGSDSEIQGQLIEANSQPDQFAKNYHEQKDVSPRTLWKPKTSIFTKTSFVSRKSQKKKTMPLPKTICEQSVRGMTSHNLRSLSTLKDLNTKDITKPFQNKENLEGKNPMDIPKKPQYPQAVLSIFKIQTQRNGQLKKKNSINSLLGYPQSNISPQNIQKARLSPPTNLRNRSSYRFQTTPNQTVNNEKNKAEEQKSKAQQSINNNSGIKTFLKAMGINIQNRHA